MSTDNYPILVSTRNPNAIGFPVIAFHEECVVVYHGINQLTISGLCHEGTLLLFQDPKGVYAVYIVVATKRQDCLTHRLLPKRMTLWFDIFVRDATESTSVELLKNKLIEDIKEGGTWEDRGDYDELVARTEKCGSLSDIFEVVLGEPEFQDDGSDD